MINLGENCRPHMKEQKNKKNRIINKKSENNKQKIREYNKTYAILRRHNDPNPLNEWREKYKKVKL